MINRYFRTASILLAVTLGTAGGASAAGRTREKPQEKPPEKVQEKPPEREISDLVISAGREGTGYWGVASRLKKTAAESGLKTEVLQSVGSLENLERLDDPKSPVNLALTQSDALEQFLEGHHALRNRLNIMESVGLECVFIITGAQSKVRTEADLEAARNFRIAIPGEESGAAVTYRFMSRVFPGFARSRAVYTQDIGKAMATLNSEGADRADAVMLVHRPKERTAEIQQALDQPDQYEFLAIPERKLDSHLPEDQDTYTFMDIPLVRRGYEVEKSLPTICTKGLLVTSTAKLEPGLAAKLDRLLGEKWMQIYTEEY